MMKKLLILLICCILYMPVRAEEPEFDDDLNHLEAILLASRDEGAESAKAWIERFSPALEFLEIADTTEEMPDTLKSSVTVREDVAEADSLGAVHENWGKTIEDIIEVTEGPDITGSVMPSDPDGPSRGSGFSHISPKKKVETKRVKIAKGASLKETFREKGKWNYMVIAERNGWVSLRVHAYNRRMGYNKRYDDNEEFYRGMNVRKKSITLPDGEVDVEVEILNRSDRDITCVVVAK